MSARRDVRPSDSPLVARITHVEYDSLVEELSTPDGCWDIVVLRQSGRTVVLQTGLISRPVSLRNGPGDSYLSISFKPGVFMPRLPGVKMLDGGLERPAISSRSFALEGETLEIPSFENAEGLVDRLARRGLLARDELVESVAEGRARAISPRSMQRHFLWALGLTPKQFSQIERARRAVELLQGGQAAAAVAADLGYADQPHMTRSLKAIMGTTPGEVRRRIRRDP